MSSAVPRIERVSANDLATLASDQGPAPLNIAALLVVDNGARLRFDEVREALEVRLPDVPRLRQRLIMLPPGLGRPIWVDDAGFQLRAHLRDLALPPGTNVRRALLDVLAGLACEPLPPDQPLWRARWITGLEGGRAALAIVLAHVVADGLGGVAALGALADPQSHPGDQQGRGDDRHPSRPRTSDSRAPFPGPSPSRRNLALDAWRARLQAVRQTGSALSTTRSGLRELDLTAHAPRLVRLTALNRPTGPSRAISVASVPLQQVIDTAHANGATVNDVVLTAVGGALDAALTRRGQAAPELVASVPVSARRGTVAGRLGNETGVRPTAIPTRGAALDRLAVIAGATAQAAARTGSARAASAGPLLAVFRGMARVGALRWFINHQRLIHTFVTNVRGPAQPLELLGHRVEEIVPVAISPSNVGVSFDVLSYAGRLVITVVGDPVIVPDHEHIAADLMVELARLTERRA